MAIARVGVRVGFVGVSLLCGCASFAGRGGGGRGDVTVVVQNATSASVCEVELWTSSSGSASGTDAHEHLELRDEPIAPGERRALDVARSEVIHHLRARSCNGVVLAQQDVSIEHDVDVVVR